MPPPLITVGGGTIYLIRHKGRPMKFVKRGGKKKELVGVTSGSLIVKDSGSLEANEMN